MQIMLKLPKLENPLLVFYSKSAIAQESIRQRTVALSIIEAEYIAANQIMKEIIWMKSLINDQSSYVQESYNLIIFTWT